MSDPEVPTQPLIRAPSQETAVNVQAEVQGGRSTRAYKVAGLTLLACVLIVGQAAIAYFLVSQRNDIRALQEQSNKLKMDLTRARSVSVPMKMHVPMSVLPGMMADTMIEEAPAGTPDPRFSEPLTTCQKEAAGMKPVQVPGFRPACDNKGYYQPQQCFEGLCWCVDPVSGAEVSGFDHQGKTICRPAVFTGALMAQPEMDA